jgi:hypothetical protein
VVSFILLARAIKSHKEPKVRLNIEEAKNQIPGKPARLDPPGPPSDTSRFFTKPVLLSPSHSLALMAFDGLFGIQSQSIVNGGSPGEFPQGSSPK